MYLNNNNNNNKYKSQVEETKGGKKGRRIFLFFLLFLSLASFSYLRKSDHKFSLELKAKLIYAWTLKSWSFDKHHEVGNFSTCVNSSLKAI